MFQTYSFLCIVKLFVIFIAKSHFLNQTKMLKFNKTGQQKLYFE